MTFLHKQVEEGNGTFGSHLRDLRDLQQLTVAQVSRDTKISEAILHAFEEDRLGELDDPAFAERHLLAYVRYLGGHEPYFIARYRERLRDLDVERRPGDLLPRQRGVRWGDLFAGPQVLAVLGVLALGTAFGGYVLWQAHLVRIPPPLELEEPIDGEHLPRPVATVRGKTIPEAVVDVNGKEAAVDGNGLFTLLLDVRRGTTLITVTARRRRGSETVVERRVVYDAALLNAEQPLLDMASSSATGTR